MQERLPDTARGQSVVRKHAIQVTVKTVPFQNVVQLLRLVQIQSLVHTEQRRVTQTHVQLMITHQPIVQRHIAPEHVRYRVKQEGPTRLEQQEVIRVTQSVHSVVVQHPRTQLLIRRQMPTVTRIVYLGVRLVIINQPAHSHVVKISHQPQGRLLLKVLPIVHSRVLSATQQRIRLHLTKHQYPVEHVYSNVSLPQRQREQQQRRRQWGVIVQTSRAASHQGIRLQLTHRVYQGMGVYSDVRPLQRQRGQ
jgi:hypothetical protein